MSNRLINNITSGYFEAANRMTSKQTRRRIVAYVESYDDVFFWRTILSNFEDKTRYFEVVLPSHDNYLERGKKAAIAGLINGAGRDMIACVDADYDYLMHGITHSSSSVLNNPYVFHTYAYAIENWQCYAPSLHTVCVAITLNDHDIFDFVGFLTRYSQIIYPLFVWQIWYAKHGRQSEFTILDFNRVVDVHTDIRNVEDAMERLDIKVRRKVKELRRENPEKWDSLNNVKEELKRLGVTPDTTYLYIQGHNLFNKIVSPLVDRVCSSLFSERQNEIKTHSKHSAQMQTELSCYDNSVESVVGMLKKNTGYMMSPVFLNIFRDLKCMFPET